MSEKVVRKTIRMTEDCRVAFRDLADAIGLYERYVFEDMFAVYCEKLKRNDINLGFLSKKPRRQYLMGDDL